MKTVLAPLSLKGVGTPLVESMASYFLRVARVHQVTINQLTQVVCNDSPYLRIGDGPKVKWRALYPAMLCSYSRQTQVLVHRLEKLTGESNLTHGTLSRLSENICRNQTGALSEIRRWCPLCYSAADDDFAEPLAWSTPLVSYCPIHEIPFQTGCAHCGERQRPWQLDPLRRTCHKCGRSLTDHGQDDPIITPWDTWCQQEMLRLLEHISSPDKTEFYSGAVKKFVNALPRPLSGPSNFRHCFLVLRKEFSKCPDSLPRLKTIFQIAAAWGTTPLDILLRPEESASPNLFCNDVATPAPPPKGSFQQQDYRRCERRLRQLMKLAKGVLLPPAVHVCREFRVSNNFQLRCVDVWKAYMVEKSARLKEHKENQVLLANRYMEKHIDKLQRDGKRLHRRNAIAQLVRDVRVPQAVARSALRVVLFKVRMTKWAATDFALPVCREGAEEHGYG